MIQATVKQLNEAEKYNMNFYISYYQLLPLARLKLSNSAGKYPEVPKPTNPLPLPTITLLDNALPLTDTVAESPCIN